MIAIKTENEIRTMAEGGKILATILHELSVIVKPGITTKSLDTIAHGLVLKYKTKPAFLGYVVNGRKYPATLCVSVNDEVVHGLPSDRKLIEGDVVSMDMGVIFEDWNLDSAITIEVSTNKASKLIETTKKALELGIAQAKPGNRVGDISHAVQKYVESCDFGIVRALVGHGIGRKLHEEPAIPNFGKAGEGPELKEGMVIAIEPMVTEGHWQVFIDSDGWTYKTKDHSLSSHFEHTVAITKNGPVVLT